MCDIVVIPDSPTPDPSPTWASRIGFSPESLGTGPMRFFFCRSIGEPRRHGESFKAGSSGFQICEVSAAPGPQALVQSCRLIRAMWSTAEKCATPCTAIAWRIRLPGPRMAHCGCEAQMPPAIRQFCEGFTKWAGGAHAWHASWLMGGCVRTAVCRPGSTRPANRPCGLCLGQPVEVA